MTTLYLKRATRQVWHRITVFTLLVTLLAASGCQTVEEIRKTLNDDQPTLQKSEIDQRDYRALTLDNGLGVLLISDPGTDKAAAALDVAVGSGSDPLGREGLAHFLEHMLFLGTARYPEAGAYQSFINEHGGSHNAFTSFDHTNYFFDVDAEALEPALDRFAQQFTAPLFTPEYVDREKNAVHSEYTAKLKDDSRRFFAVLKEGMNPEHPLSRFAVGNLETLADRDGHSVRDDLLAFHDQHYSADLMRLVVYGRESLDQLEALVRSRFADIPRHAAEATAPPGVNTFLPERLPLLITAEPVKEKRSLTLLFPVPAVEVHYRTKPLHYLSNLIGHEGEGSLLSLLKGRQLAEGLSAGLFSSDHHEALFSISIQLTESGARDYQEVIDATFAYIELLRRQGAEHWRYQEQQTMMEIAFRFQDKSAPIHYVSGLANRLHDFPPEEVLSAPYRMTDFDAELIGRYVQALQRGNVVAVLMAPGVPTDRRDRWYETPHALQPLPASNGTTNPERFPELALPHPNPFIPGDLTLLAGESMAHPQPIVAQPGLEGWYGRDLSFGQPKASFYLSLRTPVPNRSAREGVLTELFIAMAREQLNEFTYPAYLAGLDFKLYKHQRGLTLRIDGFNEKQPELLARILDTLTAFEVDPVLFARLREELQRDLRNNLKNKPFERLAGLLKGYILDPWWDESAQLDALAPLTAEDLRAFAPRLLEQVNAATLALGNLSEEQARKANDVVARRLLQDRQIVTVPRSRVVRLDAGLAFASEPTEHPDSAYLLYIQGAGKSYRDRAVMGLISQIIAPAYYNDIRTERQMGYVVFATPFTLLEVPGLAFIVQSPTHSPAQMHEATEAFLKTFSERLASLDPAEFARHQQALIGRLTEEDKTLEQRADRFWTEIDIGNPAFDSMQRIADEVAALSVPELQVAFQDLFVSAPHALLLTAFPEAQPELGQWQPAGAVRETRQALLDRLGRFPAALTHTLSNPSDALKP